MHLHVKILTIIIPAKDDKIIASRSKRLGYWALPKLHVAPLWCRRKVMKGNQSTNWLYSFAFVKALYGIMCYYSCFYQSFVYFYTCYLIFTKFCEHNKHNSGLSMIERLTLKNRKRTWSLCRAHVVLPSSPATKGQHWLQDHSEPTTCHTEVASST